jgi:hypothetical protein
MSSDQSNPVAGWYPDPQGSGQPRWWDGAAWTSQFQPATPQASGFVAPSAGGEMQRGLVICGYVFAVLIPIVGFILGIVVVTRPSKATSKHGVWIIVLSVVIAILAFAALSAKHKSGSA